MERVVPVCLTEPSPITNQARFVQAGPRGSGVIHDTSEKTMASLGCVGYELRTSALQLPMIDCTKSVKNVWLGPRWLKRLNLFLHRYKKLLALLHMLGVLAGVGALYAPAPIGRICGVCSFPLNLATTVVGLLVLRYDMIKILLRTYEFWYLSVMNAVGMVFTAIHLNDLRALSIIPAVLGFEITILIDANYRAVKMTMLASLITGAIMLGFTIMALLKLVDDGANPPILSYGGRTMSVTDGIVNCVSTTVVMLWRNATRKYLIVKWRKISPVDLSSAVRCITYRCRVRLCAVTSAQCTTIEPSTKTHSQVLVRQSSSLGRITAPIAQLKFDHSNERFNPACTILEAVYRPSVAPLSQTSRWLLNAFAGVGILSWFLVLVFSTSDGMHPALPVTSAVSTALFLSTYALHSHPRLFRLLCSSFDFWFVSIQFSLAHLCVCDALYWDIRCLCVLSSWLWMHWVLAIDTVTPIMRVRLGFSRRVPQVVVMACVAAHVVLSLELIFWNRLKLQDRAVFVTSIGPHYVQFRTVPVLFGRMATTFCWSLRLLWRLVRRSDGELMMIQGSVMYHDYHREQREQRSRSSKRVNS